MSERGRDGKKARKMKRETVRQRYRCKARDGGR